MVFGTKGEGPAKESQPQNIAGTAGGFTTILDQSIWSNNNGQCPFSLTCKPRTCLIR